jgi:hypothetical protein
MSTRNEEEYELTCFGKCCKCICTNLCDCLIKVIESLMLTLIVVMVSGLVILTIGGIGVNIYNAVYHISPFGSYDDQRKQLLSGIGFFAIICWIVIGVTICIVLFKKYYTNIEMCCASIYSPLLYKKVARSDVITTEQSNPANQANVITAIDMV